MRIIFEAGDNGEIGHTEFMTKCEVCNRAANMVYQKVGARGAIKKGHYVIACNSLCGLPASGQPLFAIVPLRERLIAAADVAAEAISAVVPA